MQRIILCLFSLMIVSPTWAETGKIKDTPSPQTKRVEIERKFKDLEIKSLEAITKIENAEKKNLEFEGKISKVELQNQVLREKIKSLESRRNLTFWSLVITIVITLLGWAVIIWKDFAVKKKEIKKSLEREAFKEINKAITKLSSFLTKIGNEYSFFPLYIKHRRAIPKEKFKNENLLQKLLQGKIIISCEDNPHYVFFDEIIKDGNLLKTHLEQIEINKIDKKLVFDIWRQSEIPYFIDHIKNQHELSNVLIDFTMAIEANEITVMKFDHLTKYIISGISALKDLVQEFSEYLRNKTPDTWEANEVERRCETINKETNDITCYLIDYRVDIMNAFLGDIFSDKVPTRRDKYPECTPLLSEVIEKKYKKTKPLG